MTDRSCIPLIANIEYNEYRKWQNHLNVTLPDFNVVLSNQLDDAQAQACEFAIVANPSPAELRRFSRLKWVQSLWAGVEKMMTMPELAQVAVMRMQDPVLADAMAEAVLAWTLYLHRDMPSYMRQQREKIWHQRAYQRASDRTVGVMGVGQLGLCALERLKPQGFKLVAWSRSAKTLAGVSHYQGEDQLASFLAQCDILVNLLPLTPTTRNLLNNTRLDQLPNNASIINFARAPIMDYTALVERLNAGQLAHAVLDVFEQEPLPSDSPLWEHPRITVLPHISGPTDPESACIIVRDNLMRYLQSGEIPTAVDYQRGY